MWKNICSATSIFILSLLILQVQAANLEFGPKTILVYENVAGKQRSQFVLRIARFKPDIYLEWESTSHQGTIHFFQEAVSKADKLMVSQLFDIGVDIEARDMLSKWLSRQVYDQLLQEGKARLKLNNISTDFQLEGEDEFEIVLNGEPVKIPVLRINDNRKGAWLFHRDPENPVLVEYTTPYYREYLQRVSTDHNNNLRWIRRLPPVR